MSDDATPGPPADPAGESADEPGYLAAVTDLLGALAYGELRAFSQLAKDAELAPTLHHKSALAVLAAHELKNYSVLTERLQSLGVEPESAMEPFVAAVDAFHERTAASDFLEGLVKAYVGEGIAQDFYREISRYVDDDTRALGVSVLEGTGQADFAVTVVREAIAAEPRL